MSSSRTKTNGMLHEAFWELALLALSPSFDGNFPKETSLLELCCGESGLLRFLARSNKEDNLTLNYTGMDSREIRPEQCIEQWRAEDQSIGFSRLVAKKQSDTSLMNDSKLSHYSRALDKAKFIKQDVLQYGKTVDEPSPEDHLDTSGANPSSYDVVLCCTPLKINSKALRSEAAIRNNPKLRKTSDWDYIESALLATKPHGRTVAIVPTRALKPSPNDSAAYSIIESKQIESITLLGEGLYPGRQSKSAMIIFGNESDTIRFFDASALSDSLCGNEDNVREKARFLVREIALSWTNLSESIIPCYDLPNPPHHRQLTPSNEQIRQGFGNESRLSEGQYGFRVQRGLSKKKFYELDESDSKAREILYIGASDIVNGELADYAEGQTLQCEANNNLNIFHKQLPAELEERFITDTPSLLISRNGYPFKIACVLGHSGRLVVPNETIYIVKAPDWSQGSIDNILFCFSYLLSNEGQYQLRQFSSGSTISQLSPKTIKQIALPTVTHEQKKTLIKNVTDYARRMSSALDELREVEQLRRSATFSNHNHEELNSVEDIDADIDIPF